MDFLDRDQSIKDELRDPYQKPPRLDPVEAIGAVIFAVLVIILGAAIFFSNKWSG